MPPFFLPFGVPRSLLGWRGRKSGNGPIPCFSFVRPTTGVWSNDILTSSRSYSAIQKAERKFRRSDAPSRLGPTVALASLTGLT